MASSQEPQSEKHWSLRSNPFKLLGLDPNSPIDPEKIRKAFKDRIRNIHPDKKDGDESLAKNLTAAYNFLKNVDADKLKELAEMFSSFNYAGEEAAQNTSNLLLDISKSEHFKLIFKAHLEYAKQTKFKDNFKSFYKQVFENVEMQPEVPVGYRCEVCMEDFICMEDHTRLIFDPYVEYIQEEINALEDAHVKGMEGYLDKILSKVGKHLTSPLNIEWNTGSWTENEKIVDFMNQWIDFFKAIGNPDKIDSSQLRSGLNIMLRNETSASIKSIAGGLNNLDKDMLLYAAVKLIENLMKMKGKDPTQIYSALRTFHPMGSEVGKLTLIDFILLAFLKHFKNFTDWSKLIVKDPWMNARLAVIVTRLDFIFNSREESYLKLGLSLVSNSCPDGASYGHLCFLLGSLDIEEVAFKILRTTDNPEARKLAAHYFLKMGKPDDLKNVGLVFMKRMDVGGARVLLYPLVLHHLREGDFDTAILTTMIFVSGKTAWKCILYQLKETPSYLLKYTMIALRTVQIVDKELRELGASEAESRLARGKSRLSKLIGVYSAAVHVIEWSKKFPPGPPDTKLPFFYETALDRLDVDAILAALRFADITSGLRIFLEHVHLLNSPNPYKINVGSVHDAFLIFVRGLYHYKIGNYKSMSDDLVTSHLIAYDPEVRRAIGAFLASNPMINEKLLRETCGAFKRISKFIDNYTGQESFQTSSFPEILQNTEVDTSRYLRQYFCLTSREKASDHLADLEKNILGKNDENSSLSTGDYAERGYGYVDLQMLSPTVEGTLPCITMAAYYFLQAMISTPAQNVEEKFAYRSLVLAIIDKLYRYCKVVNGKPLISLYVTRVMQSFILQANYLFSRVLHENKLKCDNVNGIGFIEEKVGEASWEWQFLLNYKITSPLISPKIYTISEGLIALSSMIWMDKFLLLEKIRKESFSLNVPEHLYHHYLLYLLWIGTIRHWEIKYKGEGLGRPDVIPEQDKQNHLKVVKVEKEAKTPEGVPLVKREVFLRAKETLMDLLTEAFGYDLAQVEKMMRWHYIRRTEDGFMDVGNRTLNFDKQLYSYSKFVGVELLPETGLCYLLLEPASESQPALFSAVDIFEIFGFQIEDAMLHFGEQFFLDATGREAKRYAKLPLPGVPFFKTYFTGYGPEGCESKERICGTNFLMTLYHLDLLAKMLTTGQEVSAHFPFHQQSTEEGLLQNLSKEMKNILKPVQERGKACRLKETDQMQRFWFHVGEVQQYMHREKTLFGEAIQFRYGEVKMTLNTAALIRVKGGILIDGKPLIQNGPEEQFCRDFNNNWEKIEKIFPILQRTKELAKIAGAFKIMNRNRKNCVGMMGYDSLMRINKPCTRPYSKCRWEGSVKASGPCRCTRWVPAVFRVAKVTQEQKLEYLQSKRRSKGKQSEKANPPEDSLRKLTLEEKGLPSKQQEELGTVKVIKGQKGQASSSVNLNEYDLLDEYRIYGGVQFQPKVINVPFLPPRGDRVSAANLWNKNGPPGFDRVPEPRGPRIPMSSKALPTPSLFKEGDAGIARQAAFYSIVPVGQEGSLWEGKVGITTVKEENGDLPEARWEVEEMNREAVQKGLDGRYEYVEIKNGSTEQEAE